MRHVWAAFEAGKTNRSRRFFWAYPANSQTHCSTALENELSKTLEEAHRLEEAAQSRFQLPSAAEWEPFTRVNLLVAAGSILPAFAKKD